MTRLERKHHLQELYRMSTGKTAEDLLWMLKVVDTHDLSQWPDAIARMGGPNRGRIQDTLKRPGFRIA